MNLKEWWEKNEMHIKNKHIPSYTKGKNMLLIKAGNYEVVKSSIDNFTADNNDSFQVVSFILKKPFVSLVELPSHVKEMLDKEGEKSYTWAAYCESGMKGVDNLTLEEAKSQFKSAIETAKGDEAKSEKEWWEEKQKNNEEGLVYIEGMKDMEDIRKIIH